MSKSLVFANVPPSVPLPKILLTAIKSTSLLIWLPFLWISSHSSVAWKCSLFAVLLDSPLSSLPPPRLSLSESHFLKPNLQPGCQPLTKSDTPPPSSSIKQRGSQEGGEARFCPSSYGGKIRCPAGSSISSIRSLCLPGPGWWLTYST